MIAELYEKINSGQDVRGSLSQLRALIKDEQQKRALAYQAAGDYTFLSRLLADEDAKTRKNAALLLGDLECFDLLPDLWAAYQNEQKLFVKASYIKAMANYDCRSYLKQLKQALAEITAQEWAEGDVKHRREEVTALQSLILQYEKPQVHTFRGSEQEVEVILLTNREHRQITAAQVEEFGPVLLAGGIRVKTDTPEELMKIRTFTEMLFVLPGQQPLAADPQRAAAELCERGLPEYVASLHLGSGAFLFRTEVKGRLQGEDRGAFIRKFSSALEERSGRKFLNAPSDYEMELRLLERKEGDFIPLIKFFTLKDNRFKYRREVLSTSIAPTDAALMMRLAEPWLTEGAQVLDPFCGVGTMLVERLYLKDAHPLYGIDIFPEAIEKARENTAIAGITTHFINRDFFTFEHDHRFDEIVTNLPAVTRTKGVEQITVLYEQFFEKAAAVLTDGGIILLYTREESVLLHCLKRYPSFSKIKNWIIHDKIGGTAYLLRNEK